MFSQARTPASLRRLQLGVALPVIVRVQPTGTPIALISLIEDRRQWFKAEVGLGLRETPLEQSICAQALLEPGLVVISDLSRDERFACNPLITGHPHLRFYAGARLQTREGLPLGRLCVLDHEPRDLTGDQAFTLNALARQV